MKLVIAGLTVSSSWGNGHATLWRGLIKALTGRGHEVVFFEKDVPYYAANRDLTALPGRSRLVLYATLDEAEPALRRELATAEAGMVTSYCPEGARAAEMVLGSGAEIKCFYDLDTPVTLDRLLTGEPVDYLPAHGLGDFDLVLSYTGGKALKQLQERLGARTVAPLYGSVDPESHYRVEARDDYRADLSYLGTYAADRQQALEELLLKPAAALENLRFLIGGAQYPQEFPWGPNIYFVRHMPPPLHPAFFSSCRLTLNVTRRAMAEYGFCPSGRLFEAAACGAPLLSDAWEGLEEFFTPEESILVARTAQDTIHALARSDAELQRMAAAARETVMDRHTSARRAIDLERALEQARTQPAVAAG